MSTITRNIGMKQSELNHLRRLLGWVRCDIGQDPAGQQQTMIDIADKLGIEAIDADAKARLVHSYRRAEAVPVYVRDAVKALEKTVAASGRGPGAETARATAETRANAGFDPGAAAGRAPAPDDVQILDDVQIERGLAEIGVYVWGQRGEDWLAGAEYAARILRGDEAYPAAAPLQSHPGAAAEGVACRDTPAETPTLRRDDTGGVGAARLPMPAHGVQEVQVERETAGTAESCRPAITLQVMQEAMRLMPSDEARRVARAAEAVSSPVTPEQYVGAGAVAVIAKLRAPVADERAAFEAWAVTEFTHPFMRPDPLIPDPDGSGDYADHDVQLAWSGFQQARAALASAPVAGGAQPERGDPACPRDDSDRTYDRPIGYLPSYELGRLHSGHDANLRSAKFGASTLDGDVPVYLEPPKPDAAPQASAEAEIASYALPDGTRVERAAQLDGTYLWAVRRDGNCLGLDGHWSYEPLPSSRGDEWLALHRFPSAQAAIRALKKPQAAKDGEA